MKCTFPLVSKVSPIFSLTMTSNSIHGSMAAKASCLLASDEKVRFQCLRARY